MNLAFQNWKNNKCQFNWIDAGTLAKILNHAQGKTLQTISDQEAKRLFHSLNLSFEWKEWMADDIRQSSTDRSVSRSQLDVFCVWKVLTAHNRLYAVLQVEGADHTFCLSQKGHREIPLNDDAEYFSLENLQYSGFDLTENLLVKNSELGWKRKIPSIFPMDYDPPTIFRLSYQEYMEKIPHGINVGHLESVAAIFPRQFSEQIQRGKIPELEGGMLEFLPEELNGYPVIHHPSDQQQADMEKRNSSDMHRFSLSGFSESGYSGGNHVDCPDSARSFAPGTPKRRSRRMDLRQQKNFP